ncbi:hypothetical protein [Streptomyces pilosus]|uniref:hypothetical protein n=1 Tax=Streptomyces pilosus TaxID=28893 RepID=UPI0036256AD7
MTPLLIVLAAGAVLHTIVGLITRTPEDDHTPLRWKAWHTFLAGIVSGAVILAAAIGWYAATGVLLPFWSLVAAADVLTVGWKLVQHRRRIAEQRSLQSLFDRPSLGEAP